MATINSRIVQKHAYEAEWIATADFVPRKGELIIYDAEFLDENNAPPPLPVDRNNFLYDYARFKIGDGQTKINDLPFATDIAMKEHEVVNFSEDYPTKNQITALKWVTGKSYDLYSIDDNNNITTLVYAPITDYEEYQNDMRLHEHRPASCKLLTEYVAASNSSLSESLKGYIGDMLAQITIAAIVSQLPEIGTSDKLYLVPRTGTEDRNLFDEFLWINDAWEYVGAMNATVEIPNTIYIAERNEEAIPTAHTLVAEPRYSSYDIKALDGEEVKTIIYAAANTTTEGGLELPGEEPFCRPITPEYLWEFCAENGYVNGDWVRQYYYNKTDIDNKIGDIETILASI